MLMTVLLYLSKMKKLFMLQMNHIHFIRQKVNNGNGDKDKSDKNDQSNEVSNEASEETARNTRN